MVGEEVLILELSDVEWHSATNSDLYPPSSNPTADLVKRHDALKVLRPP